VEISISSGPARVSVPDVTGLREAAAKQRLAGAGFTSTRTKRVASSKAKGTVVDQRPLGGVTAAKGTTVEISVSNGRKPVIVPSLVGLTQAAAVNQLTKVGLKPKLQNVPSTRPVGQVVAQKPPAGKEVDKGSTVVLNVSRGAGGVTTTVRTTTRRTTTTTATTRTAATTVTTTASSRVQSVRGLAVTAGVRRLNTAGLRPVVRYVASSQQAGLIVAQAPAGGTAPRGSRVRVSVSKGPTPADSVTVPDVVGQDQASGAQAVRQAGLKVVVLFRKTSDQTKDGVVIDEQPAAGSSVPRGLYVAIVVGRFSG
jgi:serine/threonine-protein kinase